MRGKITLHVGKKNFGFIACADKVERFFHAGQVCETSTPFHDLEVGDTVDLEPIVVTIKGEQKDRAVNVKLIAKAGDHEGAPLELEDERN